MQIIAAEEKDGRIIASVRFDDGMDQTVIVAKEGCTKKVIREEARRLRLAHEAEQRGRKVRQDLLD